ncbi:heme exporter protein CcmD [Oceanobacter kriegii]|uniref:heme exporter protein CcmD n=1 Tax=Oceanobacter kriegii TaxID=64972 RepID=UPI00041A8159|nr:heme exporter protein CcmD [Oceanobacter kriegii]
MEFNSFSEFLAMGRHGFYVWLSYGLAALVIAVNVILPMLQRRRLIREQAQRVRRQQRPNKTAAGNASASESAAPEAATVKSRP